ncbi:hypothetical protein ABHW52_07180 [Pediococcus pentosaceus]
MKKFSTLGLIALSAFTIATGSSTVFSSIANDTIANASVTKIIKKDTVKETHKAILKKISYI